MKDFFKDMKSNLKELRLNAGLTQEQLAELAGTKKQYISSLETGIRDIPIDLLIKLSYLYNVSIDYILELSNKKSKE